MNGFRDLDPPDQAFRGAFLNALAAAGALGIVNHRKVVRDGNGFWITDPDARQTGYASHRTGLADHRPLVLGNAEHRHQ